MTTDVRADELFGSLVRRYRTVATLTQEELATRAGLSVRAVSDMERGRTRRPFLRSVRQLADALELAPPERTQLIAAAEPAATIGRPGDWDPGFVPPLPRQLPCGPVRFTGRAEELAVLAQLAGLAGQEAGTSVVISGTAGVGKTALAVQFAHEVADRFPDGQLYVNLRGAGRGNDVQRAAGYRLLRVAGSAGRRRRRSTAGGQSRDREYGGRWSSQAF